MIIRLLVAAGLVAAAQLTVLSIHSGMDPKPAALPQIGPETLPEVVGDYSGKDKPIDERVVAASNAEAMLNREYTNRLGDSVIVNVGIWTQYSGIPHKPEECYPSAGWEIASRRLQTISVSGRKPIEFKQYVFQRGTDRIAVAYWVHVGKSTINDGEGMRRLRQHLRMSGENLPPLIKVMLQSNAQDMAQAEARLSRFAAATAPYTLAIH
jgi:EpsI family protein